jgi:hypothetical protein
VIRRTRPCWVFLLASAVSRLDAAPWEGWTSPYLLAQLDARDQVLELSSHCPGGCRYDRDGMGPELAVANPWPERGLYHGGSEVTIFDERGPGAVTRLWMTTGFGVSRCIDPAIHVRYYLDGAAIPALDAPLPQLFDGSTPPFQAPLVFDRGQSSGGYVSYVPVAYAQSLRITLTDVAGTPNPCQPVGADPYQHLLWYQLQFHRLPPGVAVASFPAPANLAGFAAWLGHQGDNPWADALPSPQTANQNVAPNQTLVLASTSGSGWLRGIRLRATPADYASLRLHLQFDGQAATDLSFAEFFARAADATLAPRGVLLGQDAGGWLYVWFPMPYRHSAQVSVSASASAAPATTLQSELTFDTAAVPADAGIFVAQKSSACGNADLTLFSRSGAGRIVGLSGRHAAAGGSSSEYLEADERLYVDGGIAPRWYGTGLEDFYNGGFYFDAGAYVTPLAGASRVAPGATTSAWRMMPTDGPSFQQQVVFRLEAGATPTVVTPACAEAVAYAYVQDRPLLVPYESFELGTAGAAAHFYAGSAAACSTASGQFEDEPPTSRSAMSCRYASGFSAFRFFAPVRAQPLRLRRVFDASVSSMPAQIFVNGIAAGWFPFAAADPLRHWKEQDAVLDAGAYAASGNLDIEVHPLPMAPGVATGFNESAYALWGGWIDALFSNGFEP